MDLDLGLVMGLSGLAVWLGSLDLSFELDRDRALLKSSSSVDVLPFCSMLKASALVLLCKSSPACP